VQQDHLLQARQMQALYLAIARRWSRIMVALFAFFAVIVVRCAGAVPALLDHEPAEG
jgi:hypothetical protein